MRTRLGLGLLLLVGMAATGAAQRPGGRPGGFGGPRFARPAIFEVTGKKLLDLNPIARLLTDDKLKLDEAQRGRLDSLNTALVAEVTPFAAQVDSLRPRGGGFGAGGEGERPERGAGRGPGRGQDGPPRERFEQLQLTVGMIKLRYDAALLSVDRILSDDQREAAAKVVEKSQRKMEEYAAPLGPPR